MTFVIHAHKLRILTKGTIKCMQAHTKYIGDENSLHNPPTTICQISTYISESIDNIKRTLNNINGESKDICTWTSRTSWEISVYVPFGVQQL